MARIITCLTLFFALLALVSGQSVDTLNTPAGPLTNGSTTLITWTLLAQPTLPGVLTVVDRNTTNTTLISDHVDLSLKQFNWTINLQPDFYNLALNDGSGQKFSGPFQIVAQPSTAGPAPGSAGPAPPTSPSPAPPTGPSPAPPSPSPKAK